MVENASKKYTPQGFDPCAIIADIDIPQYEGKFNKIGFEESPIRLYIDPAKSTGLQWN